MKIALYIISALAIIGTLLPRNDSKHWFVRGQANFRAVYLVLDLILFILTSIFVPYATLKIVMLAILGICIFLCVRTVYPYSILGGKSVRDAVNVGEDLSILIHNVYQFNTKYDKVVDLVAKQDPDIVLLLETGTDWNEGVTALYQTYPYVVKEVRDDTYGIIMMSKIEPKEGGINHFVSEDIPSAEMLIQHGGRKIRIIGIHPEPPIPGEVLTSVPKEKEILYTGNYINKLPKEELTILIGDLNDVAWSQVAKKFKKLTGMADPREGRGFYSTFPTYLPVRIPLDHVFCDPELELVDFTTLDGVGSDHFPVSVVFRIPTIS